MCKKYDGLRIRHKILATFIELHERTGNAKPKEEEDLALTSLQLSQSIGVEERLVQHQVDYLIHQNELRFYIETPPRLPLRMLLTHGGSGAFADNKYPLSIENMRGMAWNARWRTITGWVAIAGLALGALQWAYNRTLASRIDSLDKRIEALSDSVEARGARARTNDLLGPCLFGRDSAAVSDPLSESSTDTNRADTHRVAPAPVPKAKP